MGQIGHTISNFVVIGLVAIVAIWLYNSYAAGKSIAGVTAPRV